MKDKDIKPIGYETELLKRFAKYITDTWTVQKYWDGNPFERITDPSKLVEEFRIYEDRQR